MEVASVQGSAISVNAMNGVMVDNAHVVTADIETSNGVIHVIDAVILPELICVSYDVTFEADLVSLFFYLSSRSVTPAKPSS